MAYGAIIGALLGGASSIYGQSQQQEAAKDAQAAANAAAAQGTRTTTEMPKWLLPYAKAYVERQWIDSSQPYKEYGGFFQNMQEALDKKNAKQPAPWDSLFGPGSDALPGKSTGVMPDELQFRMRSWVPYNGLTARVGEVQQLPLKEADYWRYMSSIVNPGSNTLEAIGGADQKKWSKQNKLLKKYMDQPLMLGTVAGEQSPYPGLLTNKYKSAVKEQAPSIWDQYYAGNILR